MNESQIRVIVQRGNKSYSFSFDEWSLKAYRGHRQYVMLEGIEQCIRMMDGPEERFDFTPHEARLQVDKMFETIRENS